MLTTRLGSLKDLRLYEVYGADGKIGAVRDFFFHPEDWTIRHASVRTENREIFLSTRVFGEADWEKRTFFLRGAALSAPPASHFSTAGLYSAGEFLDKTVCAEDGEIGRIDDLIVNEADWAIRYLIVDTGSWLKGKKVLISPWWVEGNVRGGEEDALRTNLLLEEIRHSPEYDFSDTITHDYENKLHEYYDKPKYWA